MVFWVSALLKEMAPQFSRGPANTTMTDKEVK